MNYEVKKDAESIWFSIQTAIASATGWLLLGYTDMDAAAVLPIAVAIGSASRPVLGYLLSLLPKRTVTE